MMGVCVYYTDEFSSGSSIYLRKEYPKLSDKDFNRICLDRLDYLLNVGYDAYISVLVPLTDQEIKDSREYYS